MDGRVCDGSVAPAAVRDATRWRQAGGSPGASVAASVRREAGCVRKSDPARQIGEPMEDAAMPANMRLIRRSVTHKRDLVAFVQGSRFERLVRQAAEQRFGESGRSWLKIELPNFLDSLILQERLPDGRTVVEHYVDAHPELPEDERAMLLGWRDVVEGLFEVKRRDGEALIVVNVLDELTYRVRSNAGSAIFRQMPPGGFIHARLVPMGDEWMLSGAVSVQPAEARDVIRGAVAELAPQFPELVFRNPEKLEQAWEVQREERGHFIAFFGADQVVIPGRELAKRMRAYSHFRIYEVRDAEGKTAAEVAMEKYGSAPDFALPLGRDLIKAKTVGVIFDEVEGLNLFLDFGLLEETFANPALAADRKHRKLVLDYLKDEEVSPLPLRRLAERDPARASQVFQRVLRQPSFSWQRDGEALLRRYKAPYFENPPLPSTLPVSDPATAAEIIAADSPPPPPDRRRRWVR